MHEYEIREIAKSLEKAGLTPMGSQKEVRECLDQHFDGRIFVGWSYLDVLHQADCMDEEGNIKSDASLTEQDAREVLDDVYEGYDCGIGISWDVLDIRIEQFERERKAA